MAKTHNDSLNLRDPFPAAPHKHAIWGFYITRHQPHGFSFFNFAANYSAKHFLDLFTTNQEIRWLKDDTILITPADIEIRCEQGPALNDLMEYEFTKKEQEWEIPEPNLSMYRRFLQGAPTQDILPKSERRAERRQERAQASPDKPKAERAPKPARSPRAPKDSSLITVGQIAEQMSIDAKQARIALRKSNTAKPDAGWCWPTSEVDGIKKIIKENLK